MAKAITRMLSTHPNPWYFITIFYQQRSAFCSSWYHKYICQVSWYYHRMWPDLLHPYIWRYYWSKGSWSACSKTCSVGMMTRQVTCRSKPANRRVSRRFCKDEKPRETKTCVVKVCPPKWSMGNWSEVRECQLVMKPVSSDHKSNLSLGLECSMSYGLLDLHIPDLKKVLVPMSRGRAVVFPSVVLHSISKMVVSVSWSLKFKISVNWWSAHIRLENRLRIIQNPRFCTRDSETLMKSSQNFLFFLLFSAQPRVVLASAHATSSVLTTKASAPLAVIKISGLSRGGTAADRHVLMDPQVNKNCTMKGWDYHTAVKRIKNSWGVMYLVKWYKIRC